MHVKLLCSYHLAYLAGSVIDFGLDTPNVTKTPRFNRKHNWEGVRECSMRKRSFNATSLQFHVVILRFQILN